jgi:hypothetical protein
MRISPRERYQSQLHGREYARCFSDIDYNDCIAEKMVSISHFAAAVIATPDTLV